MNKLAVCSKEAFFCMSAGQGVVKLANICLNFPDS